MVPRLHQCNGYIKKEATGMESSKMYCPSRCRYRTHQCGHGNYPVSWGAVHGPPRKYAKLWAYQYPWYRVSTNAMVILKRKLRAWRVQKFIALVGADIALTSAWPQTTPCHGGQNRSTKEICETSGLPIPMVPRLHQCNGYIKRKLRAWRVQKCITLLGAVIALTSAGPQTTPSHGGQYRVHQGNMRNFGPTNTHGTASAPMQWLYQKEATGMESSKMYFPSRCRYRTYQCGAANYHVSWWAVQCPPRKYAKIRAYQYPWYRVYTNAMVISKGRYGH